MTAAEHQRLRPLDPSIDQPPMRRRAGRGGERPGKVTGRQTALRSEIGDRQVGVEIGLGECADAPKLPRGEPGADMAPACPRGAIVAHHMRVEGEGHGVEEPVRARPRLVQDRQNRQRQSLHHRIADPQRHGAHAPDARQALVVSQPIECRDREMEAQEIVRRGQAGPGVRCQIEDEGVARRRRRISPAAMGARATRNTNAASGRAAIMRPPVVPVARSRVNAMGLGKCRCVSRVGASIVCTCLSR
jgi:hypothetical protein